MVQSRAEQASSGLRSPASGIVAPKKKRMHELVPFLAIHAVGFARQWNLDGLHPTHYDLMVKYGARMVAFTRATNAAPKAPEVSDDR